MRSARIQVSSEIDLLKIEMIARQLDSHAVAAGAGIHLRVLQNLLSGTEKSWPPRAALNNFFRRRIFTQAEGWRPRASRLQPPARALPVDRTVKPVHSTPVDFSNHQQTHANL